MSFPEEPTDPVDVELCRRNLASYNKYTGNLYLLSNIYAKTRERLIKQHNEKPNTNSAS